MFEWLLKADIRIWKKMTDMLIIHELDCGLVGVDPAVVDRSISTNPIAYTGLFRNHNSRIWIPVKAFLIDHPRGKILVDTGWDSEVRIHPISTITYPMWIASKPVVPEGKAVDEQLHALSITPEELHSVIMTHMDIDHDSGLRLVKKAPHIYVSKEELHAIYSMQMRYVRKPLRGIHLELMPMSDDPSAPYGKSWDVFQDRTVMVYLMPGHSEGSIIIKVSGRSHFALIVGDTGYNQKSWDQYKLPGPVYNKTQMVSSLQWVHSQRLKPECIAVLAAHDPQETRTEITLCSNCRTGEN